MREQETRVLPGVVEFRASGTDGVGTLVGYASVFGKLSKNLGGFREQVDPGAFNKSLGDRAPVVIQPLGRPPLGHDRGRYADAFQR